MKANEQLQAVIPGDYLFEILKRLDRIAIAQETIAQIRTVVPTPGLEKAREANQDRGGPLW